MTARMDGMMTNERFRRRGAAKRRGAARPVSLIPRPHVIPAKAGTYPYEPAPAILAAQAPKERPDWSPRREPPSKATPSIPNG